MHYVKLLIILGFAMIAACAVGGPKTQFSIAGSNKYEASIFRQNCAICHGPEAEGKTLEDGKQIPNS